MTMEDMRRGIKRHRKVVLIVVIVLAAGLVSSFAFMGANKTDFSALKNTGADGANIQAQVDALKEAITDASKPEGAEWTFSENRNMAELYKSLAEAYLKLNDSANMASAASQAAKYYQGSLDTAPAELNDKGKADIYASQGLMYFFAGQNDPSRAAFVSALKLAPSDIEINYQYAYVIYGLEGLDAAVAFLNEYKESLPQDDANRTTVDNIIAQWTAYEQEAAAAAQDAAGQDATATDTTE